MSDTTNSSVQGHGAMPCSRKSQVVAGHLYVDMTVIITVREAMAAYCRSRVDTTALPACDGIYSWCKKNHGREKALCLYLLFASLSYEHAMIRVGVKVWSMYLSFSSGLTVPH